MEECPVCNTKDSNIQELPNDSINVECPRCGKFEVTRSAFHSTLANPEIKDKLWILSYWIRNHQKEDGFVILHSKNIRKFIEETEIPGPKGQADNLIKWIGKGIEITPNVEKANTSHRLSAIVGTKDMAGVEYVIEYLRNNHFIATRTSLNNYIFKLSFKGWERFEEIKRTGINTKRVFMAMQYGDKMLDDVYENHFKLAVNETGFELRRLDEALSAGLIDNQLRVQIRNSRFILADLTNNNLGAYWEAGYAEGLGKPVIYLCEKEYFGEFKTHFDTNHHTTIIWDKNKLEKAEEDLKATIRATLPDEAKMSDD